MTDFKDCYFETNSAEETKALLKYLDSLYYRWCTLQKMESGADDCVYSPDGVFLLNKGEGKGFTYLTKECKNPEFYTKGLRKVNITFKNVLTVDSAEIENAVVELNGKKYNKSDLEQALKLIKPVE